MIYTKKQLKEDLKEYDGVNPFVIPDIYDEIEYECFGNNKSIKSIIIPSSITIIPANCFYNSNIEEVNLPDTIDFINAGAFHSCNNLKSIKLPDSIYSIEQAAFARTGLVYIDLPSKLKVIERNLFAECKDLISVKMPKDLQELCTSAFYNDTSLKTLDFRDTNLTHIEDDVFSWCVELKKVYFPKSLKEVSSSIAKMASPQIYVYKDTRIIDTSYYTNFKYYDTLEDLINQNKTFKEINKCFLEEFNK